jgi:dihydropteroate synthase
MTFEKVRIVGILNVTPDSFSDGGRFFSRTAAVERALEMERGGADVIDVGGESTRPGAKPVPSEEELDRVLPVIRKIRSQSQIPISVDTTKPAVARAALEAGAEIINDVDGLGRAPEMAEVVQEFEAGLILMHRRGGPETMQQLTQYGEVVEEVFQELGKSFSCVLASGVGREQVVLDPGIGFAKNAEQNLELIAGLRRFHSWGRPILVGPSRKSFLGALTGRAPAERDWGTAAAVALAVANSAHLVRVHQVEAMRDVVKVAEAITHAGAQVHVRS